jgi:long-chain acyl-CoA synthetase
MPMERLQDFLDRRAETTPARTALIHENQRASYARLQRMAHHVAIRLIDLGVRPGDRVTVLLDNSLATVAALYGILKAGGIFVLAHGGTKAPRLHYMLGDSGSVVLITSHHKQQRVIAAASGACELKHIVWIDGAPPHAVTAPATSHDGQGWLEDVSDEPSMPPVPNGSPDDIAALIYTSGSTGSPKAIMCPHRSMIAASTSIIQYLENDANDIILNVLPLAFDYGLYQVLMSVMFGGTVILETSFLYPVRMLEIIEREHVTGLPVMPTILATLLEQESLDQRNLSSLRYITNTGAALPESLIRRFRRKFPEIRFYSMFGLSECKRVSYLHPDHIDHRPGSVGRPMPGCQIVIADDQGFPVPPGEIGHLLVRGPHVMAGYWRDPELTAAVFRRDPAGSGVTLHTGDRFYYDRDGFMYFAGRGDDLLKVRGERVSPLEIERALLDCPGVREAAVIGLPDEIDGSLLVAHLALDSDVNLSDQDIRRHCADRLETHMQPARLHFHDALPRSENGKIDKHALQHHQQTEDAP